MLANHSENVGQALGNTFDEAFMLATERYTYAREDDALSYEVANQPDYVEQDELSCEHPADDRRYVASLAAPGKGNQYQCKLCGTALWGFSKDDAVPYSELEPEDVELSIEEII